ncbi:hypothetical protein D3C75_696580 [compost metagenome]
MLRRNRRDRINEILRAGIHRLSAGQNGIHAEACENLRDAFTGRDGYESILRHVICRWNRRCLHAALFLRNIRKQIWHRRDIHPGRQQIAMLLPHVKNMDLRNFAILQRQIQDLARSLGMNMDLDGLIIRNDNNGISIN